ncbi:MAG: HAD hydrolase family protein [Candidatus Electryoneaceae bacterium]|nr:HAD hydrolase family protein [Candidatus Electryoneaceae bacterium]
MTENELKIRAKKIRMIILDVDGMMTDGRNYISSDGVESKAFNIKDGFAIILAQRVGIQFGIITGGLSPVVKLRAEQLGIKEMHQSFTEKSIVLSDILFRNNLQETETSYMGDDLYDIPVLERVGLSGAPADACSEVIETVDWVSKYGGGCGAIREFVEFILKAQGKWETAKKEFLGT